MICYFNMVYIANYVRLKFDSEPFNLDDCEGMLESALKKYLSPLLVFFEKKREGA